MLKLDSWLEIMVLIWYFYPLPLLFYDHVKVGVTIGVTPCDIQLG
jgi:hypothetical protein